MRQNREQNTKKKIMMTVMIQSMILMMNMVMTYNKANNIRTDRNPPSAFLTVTTGETFSHA